MKSRPSPGVGSRLGMRVGRRKRTDDQALRSACLGSWGIDLRFPDRITKFQLFAPPTRCWFRWIHGTRSPKTERGVDAAAHDGGVDCVRLPRLDRRPHSRLPGRRRRCEHGGVAGSRQEQPHGEHPGQPRHASEPQARGALLAPVNLLGAWLVKAAAAVVISKVGEKTM